MLIKVKNSVVCILIIFTMMASMISSSMRVEAYYQEEQYNHNSNYLQINGGFETITGSTADNWYSWYNGYILESEQKYTGIYSISCNNASGTGEYGIYQILTLNRNNILPLKVSGWSKAQNVSGSANEDYSIWVDITYSDNTNRWGEAKSFSTGTHDWEYSEFYIDPEKPVKNIVVYGLFRNKSGKVWFDDIKIEELPANLAQNNGFEEIAGSSFTGWASWYDGYTIDSTGGRGGSKAAKCENLSGNGEYGIYQTVSLNRTYTRPILIRGWSKAEGVSGSPDSGYSLWADITYHDGTASWGNNISFSTGTHDWEAKTLYINPEKPIKSLTVYGLYRGHSGTVLFDNISVEELLNENPSVTAMNALDVSNIGTELLLNGSCENLNGSLIADWGVYENGYSIVPTGGRNGTNGILCENTTGAGSYGMYQYMQLNRTEPRLLVISAWSKAENVEGIIDNNYCLYMDVGFSDGTTMWAKTISINTGTHDWQKIENHYAPQKPVKWITLYGMFRDHKGKVWFDDFSIKEVTSGAAEFEDACVQVNQVPQQTTYTSLQTQDGLSLSLGQNAITSLQIDGTELADANAPSGFLARDMASGSDIYYFNRIPNSTPGNYHGVCQDLGLDVNADFTANANSIKVSGRLMDTKHIDRAVTLTFALPMNASGWKWGDYIRSSRDISAGQPGNIYTNSSDPDYETGALSLYPMSAVYNNVTNKALSIAVDYNKPTHYRLDYNGGTKQLLITFEFGLVPETQNFPSSADFSFVIYRFGSDWGFRSAFEKYTELFPEYYTVRSTDQGIWMPFASIRNITGWSDFGFKYKEGDDDPLDTEFCNQNNILAFRYQELGSWWQKMDTSIPQTVQAAIIERDNAASQGDEMAKMAQVADVRNTNNQPNLRFVSTPWCPNGALWMINPNPDLPGNPNGYTKYFSEDQMDGRYNYSPKVNGEYLDTLDGWPTTMNYNRTHFQYASTPLVFSKVTKKPGVHRAFSVWEATKRIADRMHTTGNYLMANGTPHQYSMYIPWLDIMGNERNWLGENNSFSPDSDATLSKYRTLAAQKPYLMLQNTDYSKFTYSHVEKYMQRCLFYGIYPSCFSPAADDASNYWKNPQYYNRDRALFVKYVPIIKQVAEAGWEPKTFASSSNNSIYVERYGTGSTAYLTIENDSTTANIATITINPSEMGLSGQLTALDLVSGNVVQVVNNQINVSLTPYETTAIKLVSN